ncbi:hypothetical protein K435DRAFT_818340 [Dendrothele bispora CBS 962.96]|uniref:Heterokaryon incompatibility domain-containing protein n=1 Tax=Dendrothele bispora (strain CBS 962.96) TaxID=1314807 RepID=A0A4S8ME59_DENBC|nr:hypothetical protein K435DRAFT_818340 [Dendrothele bispora CBS 962.96]
MRLINTMTLQVVEFLGIDVPPYAILSHTWGDEEVTFPGFIKILKSCELARRDGFEYIWNNTCCIDKESSAELSEAINSMYSHYGGSGVCYAYLADDNDSDDEMTVSASLWRSRWFTRA